MKIKLSKSQWEKIGNKAGWSDELKEFDKEMREVGKQIAFEKKIDNTLQSQLKVLDILAQKINYARHEIDTGVDSRYVFFQLKDDMDKILQRMINDIEP